MYLSLLFGAAISRISVKRSMRTDDELATVDASLVVRTTLDGGVDCAILIIGAQLNLSWPQERRFAVIDSALNRGHVLRKGLEEFNGLRLP